MIPKRIICLTEEYVELLYLLGEEDKIIGISSYVKRPEKAIKEKPIVSSFIKGNIKKINDLKPDLILGFSDIQADLAKELIQNGHNVLITNQRSVEEIFNVIEWIGNLLNKKKETENLIQKWKEKLEHYKKITQQKQKKKVLFIEWDEPLISGIQWVEEILEILNLEPIFPELKYKKSAKERIIEKEEVIQRNPEILLICLCGKKANLKWFKKEFVSTDAIKNNQIFEIEPEIILQPGPALFEEGIDKLFHLLYIESKEA